MQMLRRFNCIDGCSDCCVYREYYPSIEYGKVGVLILPEEKPKIQDIATKYGVEVKIIPRLGIGKNKKGSGPKRIIAYQMMGKNLDGNLCPFLETNSSGRSPHGGFNCKIYHQRPLACHAYPVIEVKNNNSTLLDTKCMFCRKVSATAKQIGLRQEIEALIKIKEEISVEDKTDVWRYATAIGDEYHKSKLLPEGWILQSTN